MERGGIDQSDATFFADRSQFGIQLILDQASSVETEPVSGSFEADIAAFSEADETPLPPLPVPEPSLLALQLVAIATIAAMVGLARRGARGSRSS